MERGEREPKRMRSDYSMHSPTPYESRYGPPERSLPPPRLGPPGPPPRVEPIRRHSSQYEDPSRAYNGYEPRDIPMKQDPSFDPRPQPDMMRPNSTGHHPMHHPRPDDRRPYDHPSVTNGSLSATPQHMPPPPPQYSDRTPYYDAQPIETITPRDAIGFPIEIGYSATSSTSQKKRSARTTQACEACRHAKAKCTDPKPCQGCVEKGIDCKYDPPPPKQSDKVTTEVTTQLESLRESFENETKRRREKDRKDLERQKRQQRQLDMILKALTKGAPETSIEIDSENYTCKMKSEEEETSASLQPSIEGGDDSEEIDDQLKQDASLRHKTVLRQRKERSIPPVDPTYFDELALNMEPQQNKNFYGGEDTFGDVAADVDSRGMDVSMIPFRHTTASHYVLQWPSVIKLWKDALVKPESVEKFDPYTIEMKRGIVHLHGTGQGYERVSVDVNYTRQITGSVSGSSDSSDSAPSPIVEKSWGVIGSSPDPEPQVASRPNPFDLKPDRTPPCDYETVHYLADVYMQKMNIMHPIITKRGLEQLTRLFLKEISAGRRNRDNDTNAGPALFVGHGKRKREAQSASRHTVLVDDIRLPYTMSTATMLLILALGKICDYKTKIPAPAPAPDGPPASSPLSITLSQSPSPAQRPLPPPPSRHPKKSTSTSSAQSRHESSYESEDGPRNHPDTRNVDVIPGLAYFALAANILGDHEGENNLQMVQACLLAGLYHGQLSRPLQSYSYIYRAGVCIQWILPQSIRDEFANRPRVETVTTIKGTPEHEANNQRKRAENHMLFSFWTCLQLECDIIAELDCPKRSGITGLEGKMPWPHTDVACEDGDMDDLAEQCYLTQLNYRNHLNTLHKDLYGPQTSYRYHPPKLMQENYVNSSLVPEIEAQIVNLEMWTKLAHVVAWHHSDPPAEDILEARLRGKFYGAQNITYRHFLRAVLDYGGSEKFPRKVLEYAKKCVEAMKNSCRSFTNCMGPGERLIVTNSWGTAHAQWGNTIVLHAVSMNSLLSSHITKAELISITAKVKSFLLDVTQPGSAIELDLKFLDAVMRETKTYDAVMAELKLTSRESMTTSFSSNGTGKQRGSELSLTPTRW